MRRSTIASEWSERLVRSTYIIRLEYNLLPVPSTLSLKSGCISVLIDCRDHHRPKEEGGEEEEEIKKRKKRRKGRKNFRLRFLPSYIYSVFLLTGYDNSSSK